MPPKSIRNDNNQHSLWHDSLHSKIALVQVIVMVTVVITTITVLSTIERSLIVKLSYDFAEQLGSRVVSELMEHVSVAETLTEVIATYGESTSRSQDIKRDLPLLLDLRRENRFIAGGGLWPEPYQLNKSTKRSSFFYARDSSGDLQFYDDYNAPGGPGYHNEEWYVPAKLHLSDSAYWSKSYMDPYSLEPMVTCTVPMRKNGDFVGVATVDLRLEGLSGFLRDRSSIIGGYIFALDRNNKFLSYPQSPWVRDSKVNDGSLKGEYHNIADTLKKLPAYSELSSFLAASNQQLIHEQLAQSRGAVSRLAQEIDQNSYQINKDEALLLSAILSQSNSNTPKSTNSVKRLFISNDPILDQDSVVMVFLMPKTYWRIVVVYPQSKFYQLADGITKQVAYYIVAIEILSLSIVFIMVRRYFINPVVNMSKEIKKHAVSDNIYQLLSDEYRHELGQLAREFNTRTLAMKTLHKDKMLAAKSLYEANKHRINARDAADQAKTESQAKGEFLAAMSHELRTPINGVLGMVELLKSTPLDEKQNRYLESIFISGNTLLNVISDILDYSKIRAGRLDIESVEFDLSLLIDEAALAFESKVVESGIDLYFMIEPGTRCCMLGDPLRIMQIINNLVGNAFKFTHQGWIAVTVREIENNDKACIELHFDVIDTGVGIACNSTANLFTAFSQVDASINRKYGGTGLGLTICKKLTSLMNGKIGFVSKESKGSTFWFTLKTKASVAKGNTYKDSLEKKLQGRTLLIIGDSLFSQFYSRLTRSWLMDVQCVDSFTGAITALQAAAAKEESIKAIMVFPPLYKNNEDVAQLCINIDKLLNKQHLPSILLVARESTLAHAELIHEMNVVEPPYTNQVIRDELIKLFAIEIEQPQSEVTEDRQDLTFEDLRVLVVEDNRINQMVIEGLLKTIHIEPYVVNNGKYAVELFKSGTEQFDVILMDCEMPVMDGYEAARLIREYEKEQSWEKTLIVALTAHALKSRETMASSAGMDDYLTKPVSKAGVIAVLQKYFGNTSRR
jgi:signal transduction histidine kinase/ActR/RegA family two-component response regulator